MKHTKEQHHEAIVRAIQGNADTIKVRARRIEFSLDGKTSKPPIVYFVDSQGMQDRRSGDNSKGKPVVWLSRLLGFSGSDRDAYVAFMSQYGDGSGPISSELKDVGNAPKWKRQGVSYREIQSMYEASKRVNLDAGLTWLESRGIPRNIARRLDFGVVTQSHAIPTPRKDIKRLMYIQGPAIVSPMRDVDDGRICNALVRWIKFEEADSKQRFVALNSEETPFGTRNIDGIPLVYGNPVGALTANKLYVCEGMPDTYTAQAITIDDVGTAVVGSYCAAELPKLEPWLRHFRGKEIIIIPHLDKWRKTRDGKVLPPVGTEASSKLANALRKNGIDAKLFPWRIWLDRFSVSVKDLNELLLAVGWSWIR